MLQARARDTAMPPRLLAQAEAILLGRPAVPARESRFFPVWWLALRRRWFYLLPAGAAAGFLALAGLAAFFWFDSRARAERRVTAPVSAKAGALTAPGGVAWGPDLSAALIALHAATVASKRGDEIASSDPSLVAAWFSGRLPFAVTVPSLPGAQLLSGRVVKTGVTATACLLFERDGVLVSVFQAATLGRPPADRSTTDSKGFRAMSVSGGGVTRTLVAALPPDDFEALARTF